MISEKMKAIIRQAVPGKVRRGGRPRSGQDTFWSIAVWPYVEQISTYTDGMGNPG